MDEKKLIELSKNGDTHAFELLIEPYQKKIINIAYGMLSNTQDAYDAAQEALIKAYTSIEGFNMQSSFSTWIHRIILNVCKDELRRRKRKTAEDISLYITDSDGETVERQIEDKNANPHLELIKNERNRILKEAIDQLPQDYREVIILREISGLNYEQIANTLNCSLSAVKSRITRARKKLCKKLQAYKELF